MRKFILTPLIAILLSFGLTLNLTAQDLMITGVFDGPLTGGSPKVLELYAVNDIADMSVYTVKIKQMQTLHGVMLSHYPVAL